MAHTNPEDKKAYDRAYRKANEEKEKARKKAWYKANKEKEVVRNKSYYQANIKTISAKQKAWKKNNKALRNASYIKYQQAKRNNNFIITELDKFVEKEMYELAHLRSKETGQLWHVDHIMPLSKGGKHSIDNLQVVPASWNLSKGNRNSNVYREAA